MPLTLEVIVCGGEAMIHDPAGRRSGEGRSTRHSGRHSPRGGRLVALIESVTLLTALTAPKSTVSKALGLITDSQMRVETAVFHLQYGPLTPIISQEMAGLAR